MRVLLIAIICLWIGFTQNAAAHSTRSGDVAIGHVWAKPEIGKTMAGLPSLDVRVPMLNNGKEADSLMGAESPTAAKITMVSAGPREMIESVPELLLSPKQPVAGILRLHDVKAGVKAGDRLPLTLHFRHAPDAKIDIYVEGKASD